MLITKKFHMRRALLISFIFCLSVFLLSIAVPAQADDASDSYTWTVDDPLAYDISYHYDADVDDSGFKGWFTLTAYNNTAYTWDDFHFELFDFGSYNSSVIFCDSSNENCVAGAQNDPTANEGNITWNIYNNDKNMDIFFSDFLIAPTESVTLHVYTDNTQGSNDPFAVGYYPSVVPEPISSTLFVVGAATLGFRRFRKKIIK